MHLEPRVMDVLVALASKAPEPVSRADLLDTVWAGAVVTDGVISRCISILRDSVGDDRVGSRFIETLSRRGYRLVPPVAFAEERGAGRTSTGRASRSRPATVAIAVLPFVDLSAAAGDDSLADGLTELMIANLAGVASLRVIARTSSMVYKGARKRLREIAAELDVDYVVEGSVHRDAGRLQVVAQLIDGRSELHSWARTYTRELRDLLTLLNEIAGSVAEAVSARLVPAEAERLARRIEIGEEALLRYLTGRHFWALRSPDSLRKAGDEFAACVRLAPDFAPAYGGLADCQIVLAMYGIERPLEAAALAREHHARAFALDPSAAEVQTAQGAIALFFDWDVDAARKSFVQALASNPSYTTTHLAYGDLLMMLGEFDRGLDLVREAVRLDPFDLGLAMNLGDFLIFARRFGEAVRQLERTVAMDGRFVAGRLRLAEALALAGNGRAALAQIDLARDATDSQPRVREARAFVLAACGRRREARRELSALEAERDRRYVSAWEIARGYAVMSDIDCAIDWLRRAVDERAPMVLFSGVHAALDPVRTDLRFAGILRSVGLPLRMASRG
ncbi:MAG: winged helix-turn-helix domain-containing protein [Betaproteobacteria bacterium]|nr:winged helix-turn-helix domain-containing protein [Betaproteobacteria bacterium]